MEKIRFITDSASDMNNSREDVTILPLHIRFGEEEYADGVTISHKEFYEKLIECDTLPTTSLVSPAVFEEAYEKAVSAGHCGYYFQQAVRHLPECPDRCRGL